MFRTALALFALLGVLSVASCGGGAAKGPDVSNIHIDLKTSRFDKDIYGIDTMHIVDGLTSLKGKYPDFTDFFLDTMMGFGIRGNYTDTAEGIRLALREYLTFPDYVHLQDSINKCFPDTRETDAAISSAFQYMKYYFPSASVPKIYYINRILSRTSAFCIDTLTAAISLDMFLGPDFPHYKSVGVPDYLAPHLRKEFIPVALFTSVFEASHPESLNDRPLLDRMIRKGRLQYFLHAVMPNTPDSVLFGFTGNQVEWCSKNELLIYNFFVQQNLLYNKEERVIGSYVADGPFAKGLGTAEDEGHPTPGAIGTWLGYKLVCAFMEHNSKMTMQGLVELKFEPTQFLESAKYKPKK